MSLQPILSYSSYQFQNNVDEINRKAVYNYMIQDECFYEEVKTLSKLLYGDQRLNNFVNQKHANHLVSQHIYDLLGDFNPNDYLGDSEREKQIRECVSILKAMQPIYIYNQNEILLSGGKNQILNLIYMKVRQWQMEHRTPVDQMDVIAYISSSRSGNYEAEVWKPNKFCYRRDYVLLTDRCPKTYEVYSKIVSPRYNFTHTFSGNSEEAKNYTIYQYVKNMLYGTSKGNAIDKASLIYKELYSTKPLGDFDNPESIYEEVIDDEGKSRNSTKGKIEDSYDHIYNTDEFLTDLKVMQIALTVNPSIFNVFQTKCKKGLYGAEMKKEGVKRDDIHELAPTQNISSDSSNRNVDIEKEMEQETWIFKVFMKIFKDMITLQLADADFVNLNWRSFFRDFDSCKNLEEMKNLLLKPYTTEESFVLTKQHMIVDELDLKKDYKFLDYEDIADLVNVPFKRLQEVIKAKNKLIDSKKKSILQRYLKIEELKKSVIQLKLALQSKSINSAPKNGKIFTIDEFQANTSYKVICHTTQGKELIFQVSKTDKGIQFTADNQPLRTALKNMTWNQIRTNPTFKEIYIKTLKEEMTSNEINELRRKLQVYTQQISELNNEIRLYHYPEKTRKQALTCEITTKLELSLNILNEIFNLVDTKYNLWLNQFKLKASNTLVNLNNKPMPSLHVYQHLCKENLNPCNTLCERKDSLSKEPEFDYLMKKSRPTETSPLHLSLFELNNFASQSVGTFIHVNKSKMVYVVVTSTFAGIIPMWYGVTTKIQQSIQNQINLAKLLNIPYYEESLTNLIVKLSKQVKPMNDIEYSSFIKDLREQTGICLLTRGEASRLFERYSKHKGFIESSNKGDLTYNTYIKDLADIALVDLPKKASDYVKETNFLI